MSLSNLGSIHAYCQEDFMRREMVQFIDTHTGFWFLFVAASRWFGTVIDMVMAVFQSSTIVLGVSFCVYQINNFGPSGLGFMVYYVFALLVICQYMLRQSCEVDILVSTPFILIFFTPSGINGFDPLPSSVFFLTVCLCYR